MNNAGLGLKLPNGFSYKGVTMSSKRASAPAPPQQSGSDLTWTKLALDTRKTKTLRIKLGIKCAGDYALPHKSGLYNASIGVGTFTWSATAQPLNCLATRELKVRKM